MIGKIKKKTDRGFGFITIDGQDKDLFFHSTALDGVTFDDLQEGATVSFDIENGSDGRQSAKNVKLAEAGSQDAEPEATEEVEAPAEETTLSSDESPVMEEESKTE